MTSDHLDEFGTEQQVRQLCDEFEAVWRSGARPVLRDWVDQNAELKEELLPELLRIDLRNRLRFSPDLTAEIILDAVDRAPSASHPDRVVRSDQSESVSGRGLKSDTLPMSLGQSGAQAESSEELPASIGRFEVIRLLGRGGFGIVYEAFDPKLKRKVALKVPKDPLDGPMKRRFVREAVVAAALDHPQLVPVFEAGETDSGRCYIASALCPGMNLAKWVIENGTPTPVFAATLVSMLADGMAHSHNRGVIHRDLKPSNIMAVPDDSLGARSPIGIVPRITDFGLARVAADQVRETGSSQLIGTPNYMAPELVDCTVDPKFETLLDVYSLGVVLYELLAGVRPFERDTIVDVLSAIQNEPATAITTLAPRTPRELELICLKCLEKHPQDRYASCAELSEDLQRYLQGKPVLASQPGLLDRLGRWMTAAPRIQETGWLSIMLGLGVPFWIALIVVFVAVDGLTAEIQGELIPQTLAITTFLLFPLALVGYHTMRFRRPWIRMGLIASIVNVALVCPPLFGHVFVFPQLYETYPLGRIVAYTFLTLMFSIQIAQYAAANLSPAFSRMELRRKRIETAKRRQMG